MNASTSGLINALRQHRLVDAEQLDRIELAYHGRSDDSAFLADELISLGLLTTYQAGVVLSGQAGELNLRQHILIDLLGEGGMGRVYKARHRRLKRIDAIKVIRPDRLVSKTTLERFFREAQVMSTLNHPNIVKVYDADEDGDRHYIVMEFIDGIDLGHIIAQSGPLSVGQACACIRQAALGLQHAHEKGLIHRDIKPTNLLLARHVRAGERVKILDMGLARLNEQESPASGLTQQGQMMGTPDFMAPEQAEDSHNVDIRADIYSLGCTFYQLLTGEVPFPGGNLLDKLTRHSKEMPRRPEGLPDGLWAAIEKMMAKSRDARFAEPARVAVALAPFCDPEVRPPEPESPDSAEGKPRHSGMSLLPQTLDFPGGAPPLSSETGPPPSLGETVAPSEGVVQPSPPRAKERPEPSPTYLMPSSALWSLPPSTEADAAKGREPSAPAPPARPSRRLWVLLLGAVLLGGGITTAILWPRDKDTQHPDQVVQTDPNKDASRDSRKTTDSFSPPKDARKTEKDRTATKDRSSTGAQTTDRVKTENPMPSPVKKGPGEGKELGSGMPPLVAGKSAQNRAVEPVEVRTRDQDQLDLWAALPARTQQVVLSLDGSRAAARAGATIHPFDLKERKSLEKVLPLQLAPAVGLTGPQQPLGPMALSPDGRRLVFATLNTTERTVRNARMALAEYDTLARVEDGKTTLYYGDPGTGDPTQLLTRCLAFSPDGKHLVAGWPTKVVRWDMTREAEYHDRFSELRLSGDKTCLAFTPDSKRFVLGFGDGKLYLFPAALDGDGVLAAFQGPENAVRAAAFVGKDVLVSGDATGRLCVWKVPEGQTTETLAPQEKRDGWHDREITCVAATADRFATGGVDGKVHVGKPDAKTATLTFDVAEPVRALAFTSDGKGLLVATEKKLGVILFELPPVSQEKGTLLTMHDKIGSSKGGTP